MFDILLEIAENYSNISHDMRLQSFLASLEVSHQSRGEQPGDEFDKEKMVAIAEIYNA